MAFAYFYMCECFFCSCNIPTVKLVSYKIGKTTKLKTRNKSCASSKDYDTLLNTSEYFNRNSLFNMILK